MDKTKNLQELIQMVKHTKGKRPAEHNKLKRRLSTAEQWIVGITSGRGDSVWDNDFNVAGVDITDVLAYALAVAKKERGMIIYMHFEDYFSDLGDDQDDGYESEQDFINQVVAANSQHPHLHQPVGRIADYAVNSGFSRIQANRMAQEIVRQLRKH